MNVYLCIYANRRKSLANQHNSPYMLVWRGYRLLSALGTMINR